MALNKLKREDLNKGWQVQHPEPTSQRPATIEENENAFFPELADGLTEADILMLFPKKCLSAYHYFRADQTEAALKAVESARTKMNLYALKSYTIIKDRVAYTYEREAEYPLFMIDEGEDLKLLYQPLHADAKYKYQYFGHRGDYFMHGLRQAEGEMNKRKEEALEEQDQKKSDELNSGKKPEDINVPLGEIKLLDEIIIVPELADAFGLVLLGYFTCYHGGLLRHINEYDYRDLSKLCQKVYQVRNNTDEGKAESHQAALDNLELYTIDLPSHIKDDLEWQIPLKNLRDFFAYETESQFKKLLEQAMPYRFWEKRVNWVGRGDERKQDGYKYYFDATLCYNFLNKNGFYRLPMEGEKNDYLFIRFDGNIIRKYKATQVKSFINRFLQERQSDRRLRNAIYEEAGLNESSLANLDEILVNFVDYDKQRQLMFFNNGTYEVTGDAINFHPAGKLKRYVWDTDVIEHEVSSEPPPFIATLNEKGEYDIEVKHTNCLFFDYLIQTSRIHWRTELEGEAFKNLSKEAQEKYRQDHKFDIAGELLNVEERWEQKQHLLNKIYAIGYLMHRYKNRSQAWAVVGVDNHINSDGKSHGGSGKSICFNQAISKVVKNVFKIPGTNPAITQNQHIFHGLTKHHRLTIIDDADKALSFRFFFEFVTSDQVVNPKNAQPFTVPFDDLAKLVWLTNFMFKTDPSTNRRILYSAFSDYYHAKSETAGFDKPHEPKDDFGIELFKDFDKSQYNLFYNTMAYCLQFYLKCPYKLEPPMGNVERRKLQSEMGEHMEEWADGYFSEGAGNVDRYVIKEEAMKSFKADTGFNMTAKRFKEALNAWCMFKGYVLNPEDTITDKKARRTMIAIKTVKMDTSGWTDEVDPAGSKLPFNPLEPAETKAGPTKECIYIQTNFEPGAELNKKHPVIQIF